MAKGRSKHVTGNTITTKSWFGSHAEMIVEELDDGLVICEDDKGKYITNMKMIDSGLADPNRHQLNRKIPEQLLRTLAGYDTMFLVNIGEQHAIQI